MTQHEDWSPEQERDVYTAQAQAIVEALAPGLSEYEEAHPPGAPCFGAVLAALRQVMTP